MLIKLDIKRGCRVTGLSLHSEKSWVLVGLHNGDIEIWDYCNGFLIDSFQGDRKGAVRAVHFHKIQPLFVSGGDDCEIKVWSYKLQRSMFSLLGHGDRINSVQFHEKQPWIISGGNDQKLRIWNWESQVCIFILRFIGHITCVSFHPNPEKYLALSVTGSGYIDVCIISYLTEKPQSFWDYSPEYFYQRTYQHSGITWASFHPSLPLIVSGANNGEVKIWKMRASTVHSDKLINMGTLRGHTHSISCVLFHAKNDVIVTNSEDKTIRVWDTKKRTCLGTFNREEAFWFLASHPSINLLGAGHDNGFIVFKLSRERPAFSVNGDSLLYVKNRVLHVFDYLTLKDVELMSLSTPCSDSLKEGCRTLDYNPTENALLTCSDMELDYYELYAIPKEICVRGNSVQQAKRGIGGLSVFVERNRFAVLSKSGNEVFIKNLNNDTVKKIVLPIATDIIFPAGSGKLLCGTEDRVIMFDLHHQIVLGSIQTSFTRYVVWSSDTESVALLSKYSIVIADKKLMPQCKVDEKNRVKSGTWDQNGVFLYTTQRHIKYCLPNGEMGIIKTLGVPKYITKIYENTIFCLDPDGKICPIIVDSTEYMFKLSLLRKRYDEVMKIIGNSKLCGQAMIAYLKQKGFPEVALHVVKDELSRFTLALESGNFQMAIASAEEIADKDCWNWLGAEALRQGHTGIAEFVYKRTKDFKRLSFLYLITGNLNKLLKVMRTSEVKNDVNSQFHQALYLGDIQERIKILEDAGHLPLAYVTASVHGICDVAERLAEALAGNLPSLPKKTSASLLIPSKPLLRGRDWPHLVVTQGVFKRSPDYSWGSNVDYRDAVDADFGETSVTGEMDNAITVPDT